jgi:hypothetical protein
MFFSFAASSAPLFMLGMESDIDGNITVLWENSIAQILKEASFEPLKVEQSHFETCENIECVISAARASGAQGLFRGRLRAMGKDSISVRIRIDWLAGSTTPQTEAQSVVPLAWDETLRSGHLLKLLSKVTGKHFDIEHVKDKEYVIKVETNPEHAVVMLNGEGICLSPCDFSTDGSMAQISAYWDSGENIWAAKKITKPTSDTTKIYLELKRSFAGTEIRTNPSKAKIFPDGILDTKSKAMGKTPYNLRGLPGEAQIRIFHEGYSDTLLNVNIDAVEKQVQFVQLTPITDPQKISEQNLFIKSQNKRTIGLGLLGGSAAPFAAGLLLCVLAQDDYQKARELKSELSHYPSFGGKNYRAKIDENHKAVKDGNFKTVTGVSLIGFSLLLAGVGISLSF